MLLSKSEKNSASKKLYHVLKEEIITLHLLPGQNISEKEIVERYNFSVGTSISRTPVREAFLFLSQEGLLNIYPQKGTFVSLIDLSLVEEARFLRENLETAVVKLAAEQFSPENILLLNMNLQYQKMYMETHDNQKLFLADEEFHKVLFDGCDKSRIWKTINEMGNDFRRIRMLRLTANYDWDYIYTQHLAIINAVKDHKIELSEAIMKKHLTEVNFDKVELLKNYPDYFTENL